MREIGYLEQNKTFILLFTYQLKISSFIFFISSIVGIFTGLQPIIYASFFGLATILLYNFLLYLSHVKFDTSISVKFSIFSYMLRIIFLGAIISLFVYTLYISNPDKGIQLSDTYKELNLYLYIIYLSIPSIASIALIKKFSKKYLWK